MGAEIVDPGAEPHVTPPPAGGSRFVVIDYPPRRTWFDASHRNLIDYIVVIVGEIEMVMDDSTVTLRAGDTMIQRGTNHAWFNRGTEVARVAFVLIGRQATRHRPRPARAEQLFSPATSSSVILSAVRGQRQSQSLVAVVRLRS